MTIAGLQHTREAERGHIYYTMLHIRWDCDPSLCRLLKVIQ